MLYACACVWARFFTTFFFHPTLVKKKCSHTHAILFDHVQSSFKMHQMAIFVQNLPHNSNRKRYYLLGFFVSCCFNILNFVSLLCKASLCWSFQSKYMCRSCLRAACISKHDFQFCFIFSLLIFVQSHYCIVELFFLWVWKIIRSSHERCLCVWVSKNPRRCEFSERNEQHITLLVTTCCCCFIYFSFIPNARLLFSC